MVRRRRPAGDPPVGLTRGQRLRARAAIPGCAAVAILGPVRIPLLELRLAGVLLLLAWSTLAFALLLTYRPGGSLDAAVAGVALLPALVSAVGVARPPLSADDTDREDPARRAFVGLAVVSALLVLATARLVLEADRGTGRPALLLPSPELAYAGFLALLGTCLGTGLGLARRAPGPWRSGRWLALAAGLGVAATALIAVVFAAVVLANEATVARPAPGGGAAASADPPSCDDAVRLAPSTSFELLAEARHDGASAGTVQVRGSRSGSDETWVGRLEGPSRVARLESVLVGRQRYVRDDGSSWRLADSPRSSLEEAVLSRGLGASGRVVIEEMGLEVLDGRRTRHCRRAVDGPTALAAFPVLGWLVRGEPLAGTEATASLVTEWRGDLDYWLAPGGELAGAAVEVRGQPGPFWPEPGLQGTLAARLTVRAAEAQPVRAPMP